MKTKLFTLLIIQILLFSNSYGQNDELVAFVKENGKWGIINDKGDWIVNPVMEYYSVITRSEQDLVIVRTKEGKEGFINKKGEVIVPIIYDQLDFFSENLAIVADVSKDGYKLTIKCGYIDKTGKIVIPTIYDDARDFHEGLASVQKNNKYGYIDKTGKIVIPFIYDFADNFENGITRVKKNNKWGYVDKYGKIVIPIEYESVFFIEEIAVAEKNGKYGAIDKNNQVIIPFEYDYLVDFSEGVACARKNGKTFFIDSNNKILFYHSYEWGLVFEEGLSVIKENDKFGCMDINGNIVIPFEYDRIVFTEGLIMVRKNRLYGVINHNGDIIVPFEYDDMGSYSNGLAPVKKNNKWGYVDKFGNIIIPITFEYVTSFLKVKTNIDNANPTIAITFPTSTYQKTQNSQFTIKGTVTDDTEVNELKINNNPVNLNGSNFSYNTQLSTGQNIFNLIATDNSGNTTIKKITIEYQPQQTDKIGPDIKITQPDLRGFIVIEQMQYEIKGEVTDSSGVTQVIVNNEPANVDAQGNFSKTITLVYGNNPVTVIATDMYGNQSSKTFNITRDQQNNDNNITTSDKYYALIIGVSEYADPKIQDLNNEPTNDAKELKRILTTYYTFEEQNITLLLNPTNSEIIRKFDDLNKIITENDNFLIFYAGHGYYDPVDKLGYWLPSNADINYTDNWIYNDVLVANIKKTHSKHTLLISDACFSGSIFKTRDIIQDADMNYQKDYAVKSRNAITSGTLKTVPNKSIFFKYLSEKLINNANPFMSASDLFQLIKKPVSNNSPNIPQFGDIQNVGDEGGDFIFIRKDK